MVDALQIAKEFHEIYERLAPNFGDETRKETRQFDPESPNGQLMMAVCLEIGTKIEREAYEAGFKRGLAEAKESQRDVYPTRPNQKF